MARRGKDSEFGRAVSDFVSANVFFSLLVDGLTRLVSSKILEQRIGRTIREW